LSSDPRLPANNARAPVTIAARAPNIIPRNADRRIRVTPLHGEIKINDRAATVALVF
jgi:hypothetical protein